MDDVAGRDTALAGRRILQHILADYHGAVAVRLWNGERVAGSDDARCTLLFKRAAPLRHLLLHQAITPLGEAYLAGDIVIEGDMEALFDLVEYLRTYQARWSDRVRLFAQALRLPLAGGATVTGVARAGRAEHQNSADAIARHYDVSNEFYRLWLDPEMVYSCAYFRDAGQSLAAAQQDKLDYICRKLRLSPGQSLLDIGCGWGALVIWAARHYGVQAHGITLSQKQYDYAVERVRREGLEQQVSIERRDYRDLPEDASYDRVASVGMFEHIGIANFPRYFGTVRRVLKPDGLFLNHGITNDTGWQRTAITHFINRYVFPDGELTRISEVCTAMEEAGFAILDVESLRRHYALTLRRWSEALEAHRDEAVAEVGEAAHLLWRLYMAGSAYYFEQGSMDVYQVLVAPRYQHLSIPLRRDDLYREAAQ